MCLTLLIAGLPYDNPGRIRIEIFTVAGSIANLSSTRF